MPKTSVDFGAMVVESKNTSVHQTRIERIVIAMQERLDHLWTLDELARLSRLSRYHFIRVFSHITGISPFQFLGTLRLDAARHRLLASNKSITDICFDVGYTSQGTFTRRFTKLVGCSPRCWRRLASKLTPVLVSEIACNMLKSSRSPAVSASVHGTVTLPDGFTGLIFIGLLNTKQCRTQPEACSLVTTSGFFQLPRVPDGSYQVVAASVMDMNTALQFLIPDFNLRGHSGPDAVIVRQGVASTPVDVHLRSTRVTDPPLLLSLPLACARNRGILPPHVP